MKGKTEKGHLMHLMTQFGDVWTEALEAHDTMAVRCAYGKNCEERRTSLAFAKDTRRTSTKKQVPGHHVRHLAKGKSGGLHPKAWPTSMGDGTRAHPNNPERHPASLPAPTKACP